VVEVISQCQIGVDAIIVGLFRRKMVLTSRALQKIIQSVLVHIEHFNVFLPVQSIHSI